MTLSFELRLKTQLMFLYGGRWQVGNQKICRRKGCRASLGKFIAGCIKTINRLPKISGRQPAAGATYPNRTEIVYGIRSMPTTLF